MKKFILPILFLFALTLTAAAQEPADGPVKEFYENGNLRTTGFNINGKANGVFIEYREDGSVETVREFKDNQLHGIYLGFHKNGVLDYKGKYVNGKAVGIHKKFDEKGKITSLRTSYDDDNEIQVIFKDGKPILK